MPEIITCPGCQRQLQVPDTFQGRQVQCPTCSAQFKAQGPVMAPVPPPDSDLEPPEAWEPRRRRRSSWSDDYEDIVQRRDYLPHRGGAILTMGILSLVGFLVCGLLLILGPVAWIMGSTDLREIREGRMDPAGEGSTRAGQLCGMISSILTLILIAFFAVYFFIVVARDGRF